MRNSSEFDRRVTFAVFAILTGLISVLTVVTPLPTAGMAQSRYVLQAITVMVWVMVAIPFVAGLGILLGGRSSPLALAATLLSTGGILLLGFATFTSIGAFLAITRAGDVAPSAADAAYQAAIWSNLSFFLSDPGLMTLGFGQFLFAWLAWNSGTFPRLVSLAGFVGGLAGLLTLAVYQTSLLAIIQIGAFGIWGIATSVILFRNKSLAVP